jgi:hypothetical protein
LFTFHEANVMVAKGLPKLEFAGRKRVICRALLPPNREHSGSLMGKHYESREKHRGIRDERGWGSLTGAGMAAAVARPGALGDIQLRLFDVDAEFGPEQRLITVVMLIYEFD